MGWVFNTMNNEQKIELKKLNAVKTTTNMNLAAAVLCDTLRDAEVHFRALQHANNRGTTVSQYTDLERMWIDKVGGHLLNIKH
jgi:hypothetical protein